MKKASLLLTIILCISNTYAQQFIPFETRISNKASTEYDANKSNEGADTLLSPFSSSDNIEVHILGVGGLNDLTSSAQQGGNLAIGAYILMPTNTNNDKSRHALYVFYNARPHNTEDTSVLTRTYLFPDIGKRDLTVGYEYINKLSNAIYLTPFTELSFNKNVYDANNPKNFYSYNFLIGTKFSLTQPFKVGSETKQFGFVLYPYYQLISLDPKNFDSRDDMIGENLLPPTFHTLGVNLSLRIAQIGMFANYKWVLNNSKNIVSPDLKEGVLVVGALVSTDILKLSK